MISFTAPHGTHSFPWPGWAAIKAVAKSLNASTSHPPEVSNGNSAMACFWLGAEGYSWQRHRGRLRFKLCSSKVGLLKLSHVSSLDLLTILRGRGLVAARDFHCGAAWLLRPQRHLPRRCYFGRMASEPRHLRTSRCWSWANPRPVWCSLGAVSQARERVEHLYTGPVCHLQCGMGG